MTDGEHVDPNDADRILREALAEIAELRITGASDAERLALANRSAFALMEDAIMRDTDNASVEAFAPTREALIDLCATLVQHAAGALIFGSGHDRSQALARLRSARDRFITDSPESGK